MIGTAVVALVCALLPVAPAPLQEIEESIVKIRAGGRIGMKDPNVIRTGIKNPKGFRYLFDHFIEVDMNPKSDQVGIRVTHDDLTIEAARTAVGQVFKLRVHMMMKHQESQRRNKRDVWVTLSTLPKEERVTLVVDFPALPELRMAEGQQYDFLAPKGVRFLDVKSKRKKKLEARSSERKVLLIGKKSGSSPITLAYEIGPAKLTRKVAVDIRKKAPTLEVTVAPGATATVTLEEIEKKLNTRNAKVVDVSTEELGGIAHVKSADATLQIEGLVAGQGQVRLVVDSRHKHRNSKTKFRDLVTLAITVAPTAEEPTDASDEDEDDGR